MIFMKRICDQLLAIGCLLAALSLAGCNADPKPGVLLLKVPTSHLGADRTNLKVTLGTDDVRSLSLEGLSLDKPELTVGIQRVSPTEPDGTTKVLVEVLDTAGCKVATSNPFTVRVPAGGNTTANVLLAALVPPVCDQLGQDPTDAAGSSSAPDGGAPDGAGDSQELCTNFQRRCWEGAAQECQEGRWVVAENCPYLCRDGICVGQCEPGVAACRGLTPVSCLTDATPSPGEACSSLCEDGACTGQCAPRSRRCDGNTPELCNGDGVWTAQESCSSACQEGFCKGCTKGATECNGDTPYTCDENGEWQKGDPCPFFCNSDTKRCEGVCKPGTVRCGADQKVETCDSLGAWQIAEEPCRYLCQAGGCVGECRPGAVTCSAGNVLRVCSPDGLWLKDSECEFVCKKDTCAGVCTPNDQRCNPSGESLQVCSDDGTWIDTMSCAVGCQAKSCNDCRPGSSRCTGPNMSDAQSCGNDGRWNAEGTSCSSGCTDGGCNECSDGTRCTNDGNVQSCVNGTWGATTSCDGKGCLEGQCNKCTPGARRCVSEALFTCKTDGSGENQLPCGPPGCTASGDDCNLCKPSESRCSADKKSLIRCSADGAEETTTPCGTAGCNDERKACNVCKPDERDCAGTVRRTCAADGSAWATEECGVFGCSEGRCNACGKDDRRCSSNTPPYGDLELCKDDQSGWLLAQECQKPAGCNPNTLKCNACVPGSAPRCIDKERRAVCRADGTGEDVSSCGAGKYCSGGSCVACPTPPAACTGVGSFCTGTTAVTCGHDSNGCLVQTGTTNCETQVPANGAATCQNGACGYTCPNACVAGSKKCGPNGGVQTCGNQTCPTWGPEVACPTRQTCGAATAECTCPAPPFSLHRCRKFLP